MRIVSFFSAKGGTGKTTFNLLFASYLRYQKGLRVLFLDFDGPEFNAYFVRQRELERFDGDIGGLYPIEYVEGCRVEPGMTGFRGKPGMTKGSGMTGFTEKLRGLEGELDYVVMDFAGSFSAEDAVCQLSLAGAIDLIVIPTELDSITIASCKALSRTFAESGNLVVWLAGTEIVHCSLIHCSLFYCSLIHCSLFILQLGDSLDDFLADADGVALGTEDDAVEGVADDDDGE